MTTKQPQSPIKDVQSVSDARNWPVTKVGVKDIKHPILLAMPDGTNRPTVANISMYVNLPHYVKGTHMSRFLELLNEQDVTISYRDFVNLLYQTCDRLNADNGFISLEFTHFMKKTAPVSKIESLMDYEVRLTGKRIDNKVEVRLSVVIPVTSLCPCSKEISKYGAHNQRSHLTIHVSASDDFWIEDVIKIAEPQASSELYGILKRPDEKYVTEKAYENPKFVEDLVRDIATALSQDSRIDAFEVESENFESIHNHSAYAMISSESLVK